MKRLDSSRVVLFVDDEPRVLKSIERTCRNQQWTTLFAESGAKALELMRGSTVDVVVSDMRMPRMKGSELIAHIAEEFPDTACALISGFFDRGDTIDAINSGNIHGFLIKPWTEVSLNLVIRNCLKYRRLSEEHFDMQIPNEALTAAALVAHDVIIDEFEENLTSSEYLSAGLVLSRDLVLPGGVMLLEKNKTLGNEVIQQVLYYEHNEGRKLEIFVYSTVV